MRLIRGRLTLLRPNIFYHLQEKDEDRKLRGISPNASIESSVLGKFADYPSRRQMIRNYIPGRKIVRVEDKSFHFGQISSDWARPYTDPPFLVSLHIRPLFLLNSLSTTRFSILNRLRIFTPVVYRKIISLSRENRTHVYLSRSFQFYLFKVL